MWTSVDPQDRITLLRCIAIAAQMDIGYRRANLQLLQHAMVFRGYRIDFYQDAGFQMFLAFAYSRANGHWIIAAIGFVGATPQDAADVMALYLTSLLHQPTRAQFYMFKPATAPLAQFYGRLSQSSLLLVDIVGSSELGEDWRIERSVGP